MADTPISPKDFGASFKTFMEQMALSSPIEEPFFPRKLREHFGADPTKLTIVTERFGDADHPNVHLAIEAYVTAPGRSHELLGILSDNAPFMGLSLGQLIAGRGGMGREAPAEGPVTYTNVRLDGDRVLACTNIGLYLVRDGDQRVAIFVQGKQQRYEPGMKVEVLATDRASADAFFAAIRTAMRKRNVYRGHVVSLGMEPDHSLRVDFHRLRTITREQIILPAGLLERIERQAVSFSQHADRLIAAGRHLKRGMLLHGSPGTGKTLSAMYLAGRMPDRTVLLITGRGMGLLEQACTLARMLQPATIILEDVDLIAEERTRPGTCGTLLFELLNQMDGLAEDADILFVLTTNRPDILEPALAARPGRIDLAIEVPLPDVECRRRLFELYGQGLDVQADITTYVDRTAGASAAFIRELLRKAALFAADDGGELRVKAQHFDEALHEMLVDGGELTKRLLGAAVRT